jgi:hypothetical protein
MEEEVYVGGISEDQRREVKEKGKGGVLEKREW